MGSGPRRLSRNHELLLRYVANPNVKKHPGGVTPLGPAAGALKTFEGDTNEDQYEGAVRLLINAGGDPSAEDDIHQRTVLHRVLWRLSSSEILPKSFIRSFNLMLRSNKEVLRAKDIGGWTLLHLAAMRRSLQMVKLLLDEGSDVRTGDKDGKTPLELARSEGAGSEILNLLQSRS